MDAAIGFAFEKLLISSRYRLPAGIVDLLVRKEQVNLLIYRLIRRRHSQHIGPVGVTPGPTTDTSSRKSPPQERESRYSCAQARSIGRTA